MLEGSATPTGAPHPPKISAHGSRVLITAEPNCVIYFTTDGKDPTPASPEFPPEGNVELGIGQFIVKAIAVRNGAASPSTSILFHYVPKALAVMPEDGGFESSVTFTVVAEHPIVRYSTDGFVPTAGSPLYEGPVTLSTPGMHVVTVAMFDGLRVVGEPVRRRYEVLRPKMQPPRVDPASGSYDCPLRVTLTAPFGDVFYTVDGSAPSPTNGTLSNGTLTLNARGDIEIRAVAVEGELTSSIVSVRYNIKQVDPNDVASSRTVAALPSANVEFVNLSEDAAKAKVEEVMAWLLAAAEIKERRLAEATAIERELFDARDHYRETMHKVDTMRRELILANAHRCQLEEQQAQHKCAVAEDLATQLEQLRSEIRTCSLQERSIDAQLEEALSLHSQAVAEKSQLLAAAKEQRLALESTFLAQKRELSSFGENILVEAAELEMVAAEQRHEIALLKGTLDALQRRTEPKIESSQVGQGFLPSKKLVELPSVETLIPIPSGMLRKITTVQGDGLHMLRRKHYVEACVVSVGRGLGIKVIGHSAGVHGFLEDVDRLLGDE